MPAKVARQIMQQKSGGTGSGRGGHPAVYENVK